MTWLPWKMVTLMEGQKRLNSRSHVGSTESGHTTMCGLRFGFQVCYTCAMFTAGVPCLLQVCCVYYRCVMFTTGVSCLLQC